MVELKPNQPRWRQVFEIIQMARPTAPAVGGSGVADENFVYAFKGSPPAAACRASGGRWPRCGSPAGRDQHRPRANRRNKQPETGSIELSSRSHPTRYWNGSKAVHD
ncbi:hypothetical protein ACQP1V_00935 [Microtetraspora malaysiensis]|uniref:hypothetical protein n=1 Tax=Microtetraspora malaysiensis TaxID=161358 RepID=UPI003D943D95